MEENAMNELVELAGLDIVKKLHKCGVYTLDDLIKKDIPKKDLRAKGLSKEDLEYLKQKAKQRINRLERATVDTMFLGPQAENADLVEKLITDVLRDHIFWRRNFHPEDPFVIREEDKRTEEFERNRRELSQNLNDLLRKLKRNDIPFSNPRYIGHMLSDQLIPGIVGYFAAMLYNPNNITEEASPETTDLEIEFGKELASLLGYKTYEIRKDPKTLLEYDRDMAWGHICSGGTIANLEALWVARNLKYLPLAIRRVLEQHEEIKKEVKIGDTPITELTAWQLLNISPSETLDLRIKILKVSYDIGGKRLQDTVEREILSVSLPTLGLHSFIMETQKEIFKDTGKKENQIKQGVIIVPSTRHYSLAKIAEVLGLGRGQDQLISIPIRENFRMDEEVLQKALKHFYNKRIPVIAVISVCGSTEEAAIDPIHKIEEFRKQFRSRLSFYHHCDAAYGGYIRSLFQDKANNPITPKKVTGRIHRANMPQWPPDEDIVKALTSINKADSVTIDPHKLGYIPYPAGAVIFKDGRVKWEIAFNPGYLALPFIGSYILEGSKPGAAAAACWLSTKVLPLNESGHGILITRALKNTYTFLTILHDLEDCLQQELKAELGSKHFKGQVKLRVLNNPPDMNMLCFLLNWDLQEKRHGPSLLHMNCFAEEVYNHLKFTKDKPLGEHNFIISYTRLKYDGYGTTELGFIDHYKNSMHNHLKLIGIDPENFKPNPLNYNTADMRCCDDEIFALRCTIMNPWIGIKSGKEAYYYMDIFKDDLKEAIKDVVMQGPQLFKEKVKDKIDRRGGPAK